MTGLRELLPPDNRSLSALASVTSFTDASVRRQAMRVVMDRYHMRLGGMKGKLGLVMNDLAASGTGCRRTYSGGSIELMDFQNGPSAWEEWSAAVRFCGYHIYNTNDVGDDEPYFIFDVKGLDNDLNVHARTIVDGSSVGSGHSVPLIMPLAQTVKPPFLIQVTAMDHDAGDPEEASNKVAESLKNFSDKVVIALTVLGYGAVGSIVSTFTSIFSGTVGDIASALFGMGDDHVGVNSTVIADYDHDLEAWKAPHVVTNDPEFTEPYNVKLVCNNGDGGSYAAYFMVTLERIRHEIQPDA